MKSNKYYYLVILIILSTVDRFDSQYLSSNIMGITVRYSHILSIYPALKLIEFEKPSLLLNIFIISIIFSGIFNNSCTSAIASVIAVLFSFYIFYLPGLSFAKNYPDLAVQAILQASRILLMFGIALQICGYTERMHAFFYEPAYMSIFLAAYASLCFTERKMVNLVDYILLVLFFLLSKSAAFILVLIGVFLYYIFRRKKILKLLIISYFVLALYYVSINKTNLNYNIVDAALSFDIENLVEYSKIRTGERFTFFMLSLDEVFKSPLFGIGARTFQNNNDGIPPANIFFQVILEGGLMGLVVCLLAMKNFFCNIKILEKYKHFIACTAISLLVTLQIESTYLRAYLWVFFGIFNGIILYSKKTKESI